MTRYVEAATLGQSRQNHDDTCGVWRKPGWSADPRAYRCVTCNAVVPWSKWTEEQRLAWESESSMPTHCDHCSPVPANARPVELPESWDDDTSHAGAGIWGNKS